MKHMCCLIHARLSWCTVEHELTIQKDLSMKASLCLDGNPCPLPDFTCNSLLLRHCANLSGFIVDTLTQAQASRGVFKPLSSTPKREKRPATLELTRTNRTETKSKMNSRNCNSLNNSQVRARAGTTTPRSGPPEFKQGMIRQFKSKTPKKGVKGSGDEIPGMDGLGTDTTVVCPWEAFSHLELNQLAQYGII
ncbi:uncharacterized protein [Danio rerio]|uniref:Rhodopsin-sensitive cGMP 3',5'-cyclic phosphodiesterase subunit gamma n=1 Tax=Danio rerio TaxID=7955 RepID=A0A8M1RIJ4_DANRE|nr:uncharacterized protein LOC100534952 isoform X2 [Danio rerio]|eukprot:XP_003198167.3 uncharacterized protein LOC100534952 isoform X2 [Danio rerio]